VTHLFKLDLSAVYLHTLSRNWIIPVAIVLVMSALSFPQLRSVGVRPIVLFVAGSAAIATLPPVLLLVGGLLAPDSVEFLMTNGYWRGFVPIVGGWIGGSTSQLVLKEIVNCPENLFLSVIVIDNILVNLWTIVMFQVIKVSDRINAALDIRGSMPDTGLASTGPGVTRVSYAMTTAGTVLCVLLVNLVFTDFLQRVVALSIAGLLLGNFVAQWNHRLVLRAGGVSIVLIMAILGLRLDFAGLSLPTSFVVICVVWLIAHYAIMFTVAKVLDLHMAWVPIASMANLGGISTAPAVTSAYNKKWMPHAILLAILSMVTGNFWGMLTIFLFEFL
jgi:uncharacterized membrane protein